MRSRGVAPPPAARKENPTFPEAILSEWGLHVLGGRTDEPAQALTDFLDSFGLAAASG